MSNTIEQFVDEKELDEVSKEICDPSVVTIPTRIPEEKLKAIGLIIARFQRLELTIKDFIHYLVYSEVNDKYITYTYLSQISFQRLIAILESMSIQQAYSEQDALNVLIKKCRLAEQIRNIIVHSVWSWGIRSKMKINNQKKATIESESLDADILENVANTIYKLDIIFNHLLRKLVGL